MDTVAACQARHWPLALYCFPFGFAGGSGSMLWIFIAKLKQFLCSMYSLLGIVISVDGVVYGFF